MLYILFFRVLILSQVLNLAIYKNVIGKRLLIIGAGDYGKKMAKKILQNKFSYYEPVGFLDDNTKAEKLVLPLWGSIKDVHKHKKKFDEILISINNATYDKMHLIIETCKSVNKPVHVLSALYNVIPLKKNIDEFDNFHAFPISNIGPSRSYKLTKRLLDIFISLCIMLMLIPLWITIAMAIKINSKGPIFFKKVVIGKNEKPFTWYKFRSMYINTDDKVHRKLIEDMASGKKKDGKKLQNDKRITSVGKILRKYSLDEFPQLINVFFGEMSLVGPRPMSDYEVALLSDWQKTRFNSIPGITGAWQVHGRNDVGFNDQLILDKYYIENRSLVLDFEILLKTIPIVVLGKTGL